MSETTNASPLPPLPQQANGVAYAHIPGYFGYCAGDDGSIWSAYKPGSRTRKINPYWSLRRLVKNDTGHLLVALAKPPRKPSKQLVHRLVLAAFVGPCPSAHECCHRNGNPSDNRLENLYWGTRSQNMADSKRHGTIARGERHGQSKLNQIKVAAARVLLANNWSQKNVGKAIGVSQPTINRLANGDGWADVPAIDVDTLGCEA
jgi:hypothetical protein